MDTALAIIAGLILLLLGYSGVKNKRTRAFTVYRIADANDPDATLDEADKPAKSMYTGQDARVMGFAYLVAGAVTLVASVNAEEYPPQLCVGTLVVLFVLHLRIQFSAQEEL